MEKKARLRTSADVYHRIKWETTRDASNFVIGYMDRFAGMMEIPFNEFIPIDEGGEIPFTKVFYFKEGDKILWDREARIDLIFHSGETGEQQKKANKEGKNRKKRGDEEKGKNGLHRIVVTHRRYVDTPSLLTGRHGDCHVVDVTSDSADPKWVKFSPYFPHGEIPVPFSPNHHSECVEGIWQGLKVFEHQGVDEVKFKVKAMKGLKRAAGGKRGAVRGHSKGVPRSPKEECELLAYVEARKQIYIPSYKWVLDNCLREELKDLRQLATQKTLVLLDYDTNQNVNDLSSPLSHASLIKRWLENDWNLDKNEDETEKEEKEKEKEKGDKEKEKEKEKKEEGEKGDAYDSAAYSQGAGSSPASGEGGMKALPQREPRGGRNARVGNNNNQQQQIRPTRQKQQQKNNNNSKAGNNNKNSNKKVEKEERHDSTKPPPGGVFRKLKSCGVLVFTSWTAEKKEFLLMKHAPRYDLPKGHLESGETEIECAMRELREETGILAHQVKIDPDFLYTETYYPKYRRFGGEVVEKTICIFLGELTDCAENKDIKNSIKLTEHIGYEWIEWSPPFTHLQKLTVGPLIEAVQKHFAGEKSASNTQFETKEQIEKENSEDEEDDEEYDDEDDEDEDGEDEELTGDGKLNEPLPEAAPVDAAQKAKAARANRKSRRKRNVLMQAGYSLLEKADNGQVGIFDNKDINFSSKALTDQAKLILRKNHKASFKVNPDVLKYDGENEYSDGDEETEAAYRPPPRGNLGAYLDLAPSSTEEGEKVEAAGGGLGTEWTCPTCTFINPPSLSPICSMCETQRPN